METLNCMRCKYRHEDNGNCTAVGGFCTAVPAAHCPLLRQYLGAGMTPEQAANAKTIIESAFADDTLKAERIRKLLAADKEDRVMILPCKVGDTVFARLNNKSKYVCECKVKQIVVGNIGFVTFAPIGAPEREYDVSLRGFGKTVFLSREEAEKALQEMEGKMDVIKRLPAADVAPVEAIVQMHKDDSEEGLLK